MFKIPFFCPIFNTSTIEQELACYELALDEQGLFRALEAILLPGTEIIVVDKQEKVSKVIVSAYAAKAIFIVLNKFLTFAQIPVFQEPLSATLVLQRLQNFLGRPYVWGGNWVLEDPHKKLLEARFTQREGYLKKHLLKLFSGLDCSGLLYAATLGYTPRNTSELVSYGFAVEIQGLDDEAILDRVRPLDLLVWKGHVLIFLNRDELIESRHPQGVVIAKAKKRLEEIRLTRSPAQEAHPDSFVIRRWHFKPS